MRVCPECGCDLSNFEKKIKQTKDKSNYLKSASILTIISSSLCIIVIVLTVTGILGLINYYGYSYSYYDTESVIKMTMWGIVLAFSCLAFIGGIIAGILILFKRFSNIVFLSQSSIIIASFLFIGYNYITFIFVGIPVFTMALISVFLTNYAIDEFIY